MGAMRRYLLATVSAAALSTSAIAADLPVKAPPPVVVAPNWAGFYIGINAGAAWHDWKFTDLTNSTIGTNWSDSKTGFTGGGQIGYNWQSGQAVFGLEADFSWVGASVKDTTFNPAPRIGTAKVDWLSTVRGRLGLAINPLFYITGGVAFARVEDHWALAPGHPFNSGTNQTRVGWTAGGGIEHRLSQNWTIRAEALYVDLGRKTVIGIPGQTGNYRSDFENTLVVARGALNWKW